MKKNILIIGGDSFIATNFIKSFQKSFNFKIVSRKKSFYSNEFIIEDLFEIPDKFFHGIDVIMNFCAIVHRKYVLDELYKKINYDLPVFLFKKSLKYNIKHFIQMSSISVYKRNNNININSSELPDTSYGYYKLKTDNYILNTSNNKINTTCIRSPLVYGAIAPGNLKSLINLAKLNLPLPFKDIDNKLSFINIKNLTYFLNIVINEKLYGIMIPTDKNTTSTKEIVKLVRANLNRQECLFILPKLLKVLLKTFLPNIFNKLFQSLFVESNVDEKLYKPKFTINDGVMDYLKK